MRLRRWLQFKHKTRRRKGGTYPFLWQFVGRGLGRLVVDPGSPEGLAW
jgi:hypothetical protein